MCSCHTLSVGIIEFPIEELDDENRSRMAFEDDVSILVCEEWKTTGDEGVGCGFRKPVGSDQCAHATRRTVPMCRQTTRKASRIGSCCFLLLTYKSVQPAGDVGELVCRNVLDILREIGVQKPDCADYKPRSRFNGTDLTEVLTAITKYRIEGVARTEGLLQSG